VTPSELLLEAFGRLPHLIAGAVEGLSADQLAVRLDPDANSIAWLVWHLTRVQDDHVAQAFDTEQRWTAEGWSDRFALPFDDADIGYGHTTEEVAAVRADADLILGYSDTVLRRTLELVQTVSGDDLDRVVDRSFDPPVTLGVRLTSVLQDDLEHLGQANFIRGIVERADG
jgi:hypothetical protein